MGTKRKPPPFPEVVFFKSACNTRYSILDAEKKLPDSEINFVKRIVWLLFTIVKIEYHR